ncbi:Shedu anti-phage system protein SduA domain-containing protein [Streptomyces incarnatus]
MKYWLLIADYKSRSYDLARDFKKWDPPLSLTAGPGTTVGDGVVLWRGARGGGVVAIGTIAHITEEPVERLLWPGRAQDQEDSADSAPTHLKAAINFGRLMLASPLPTDVLSAAGMPQVQKSARSTDTKGGLIELSLSESQWKELLCLADRAQPPTTWPAAWNIPPGSIVQRLNLHEIYGGNSRVTTCTSGKTPNAFVFIDIDAEGELAPHWDESILMTPGHGQTRSDPSEENLALLAHQRRGVPLRGFITRGSQCLYIGEFAVDTEKPVERWVIAGKRTYRWAPNREEEVRRPIFRLRQLNGLPVSTIDTDPFLQAPSMGLSLLPSNDQPAESVVRNLLNALERDPGVAASLGRLDEAQVLAALMQRARRKKDLDDLQRKVEDPSSSEADFQELLQRMTWLFGGEFLPGTARRNLTPRDQLDLALLRPDGTLHGVELKQANIKRLVVKPRSHFIVGREVHEAASQAMNYLRELDERRSQILVDFGVDIRRASFTVVIGHRNLTTTGATPEEIDEAIRTYNSHLSRVSVITYDRLVEDAQRAFDLSTPEP